MADMIGRAVWRASRTSLGFVVAPPLLHLNRVGKTSLKFSTSKLRCSVSAHSAESRSPVVEDVDVADESPLSALCQGKVPDYLLRRAEELGFSEPTHVQREALPLLLSGQDCILHAQVT